MSTITTEKTIHTGCPVTDRGNGYGRCQTHHVRVYRDGHDWHVLRSYEGDAINVLDHTRGRTGDVVSVTCPSKALDIELAEAAGYVARDHFGFAVTRYDDGTASVSLWKD